MVDAAKRGWRDSNGLFTKVTVEKKILPVLNEKLGCQRTHPQYVSRLKWFKARYTNYSRLMLFNSGFGWDPITKKFTAPDEVWEEYFKVIYLLINLLKIEFFFLTFDMIIILT